MSKKNRDIAIGSPKVVAALRCMADERGGPGGGDDPLSLEGTWRLVLTTTPDSDIRYSADLGSVPPRSAAATGAVAGEAGSKAAGGDLGAEGRRSALVARTFSRPRAREGWAVPQLTLPLPLGLRADCSGRLGAAWPNEGWELRYVLDRGLVGGVLPWPLPAPPPAAVLTVDERILVTRGGESPSPVFEVWIRE